MPDFPSDFIYSGGRLDALYTRYSLRCRVESEDEKLQYWPQIVRLDESLQSALQGWREKKLSTDQALWRLLRVDEEGACHVSGRNAPLGGTRNWTRDHLHKISTRYLSDNAHLKFAFDHEGRIPAEFYTAAPAGLVGFLLTEFMASRQRVRRDRSIVFRYAPHDFVLRVGGYHTAHETYRCNNINQYVDFFVSCDAMSRDASDTLALTIGRLAHAKHIYRVDCPFKGSGYTGEDGNFRLRHDVEDGIEDAVEGRNRYGSIWRDLLAR